MTFQEEKESKIRFAIKNPRKAVRLLISRIDNQIGISDSAKASNKGERLVVKKWEPSDKITDFCKFAHTQRYEWVKPQIQNLACLDDGCGSGYGTHYLSQNGAKSIIGVDLSADAIRFAQKRFTEANCNFENMNSLNLAFDDNSFDAVISFDVIEHVTDIDQRKFLSEFSRVLKKDGIAFIGCPNVKVSGINNPFHLKELSKDEFQALLCQFFGNVKMLGQDIIVDGKRQKENWYKHQSDNHFNGIITGDCDLVYGLLAICKGKL